MSGLEPAAQLRARARSLRAFAVDLESTPAMSLERDAGPDTWRLPRAERCVTALLALQTQVHQAADDLRWTAHRLDVRANELDAIPTGPAPWIAR